MLAGQAKGSGLKFAGFREPQLALGQGQGEQFLNLGLLAVAGHPVRSPAVAGALQHLHLRRNFEYAPQRSQSSGQGRAVKDPGTVQNHPSIRIAVVGRRAEKFIKDRFIPLPAG